MGPDLTVTSQQAGWYDDESLKTRASPQAVASGLRRPLVASVREFITGTLPVIVTTDLFKQVAGSRRTSVRRRDRHDLCPVRPHSYVFRLFGAPATSTSTARGVRQVPQLAIQRPCVQRHVVQQHVARLALPQVGWLTGHDVHR